MDRGMNIVVSTLKLLEFITDCELLNVNRRFSIAICGCSFVHERVLLIECTNGWCRYQIVGCALSIVDVGFCADRAL